jgi:hypothetical protein
MRTRYRVSALPFDSVYAIACPRGLLGSTFSCWGRYLATDLSCFRRDWKLGSVLRTARSGSVASANQSW